MHSLFFLIHFHEKLLNDWLLAHDFSLLECFPNFPCGVFCAGKPTENGFCCLIVPSLISHTGMCSSSHVQGWAWVHGNEYFTDTSKTKNEQNVTFSTKKQSNG